MQILIISAMSNRSGGRGMQENPQFTDKNKACSHRD